MENHTVTIVVSPAERFSSAPEVIKSIYANTRYPFKLVYVDNNSPKKICQQLEQIKADSLGFVRSSRYLTPNQSRNLGASKSDTQYTVFIENDVFVSAGWLTALVNCAKEADADIVTPLVCIGEPISEKIHLAGGEMYIELQTNPKTNRQVRRLRTKHHFPNQPLSKVREKLSRTECSLVDLHCVLVRTAALREIGGFDENLLSTREHADFCLSVAKAGGALYCEPSAVVTYVPGVFPNNVSWSDLPYFMLRWSDEWERVSLDYFREKWDLMEDDYFRKRYKNIGLHRTDAFTKPLLRQLLRGRKSKKIEKIAINVERYFNHQITKKDAGGLVNR